MLGFSDSIKSSWHDCIDDPDLNRFVVCMPDDGCAVAEPSSRLGL